MYVSLTEIQHVLPEIHKLLSDRLPQLSTSLHLKTLLQILSEAYQGLIGELSRFSATLHLKPSSLAVFALTPVIWLFIRFARSPGRKELKNVEKMQDV